MLTSCKVEYQPYVENDKFLHAMGVVVMFEYIFGKALHNDIFLLKCISKLIFLTVLSFTCLVFWLGVFERGDPLEMWTQLFLYIIPLLAYPCGARSFESRGYKQLMNRNTTDSFMVRFFTCDDDSIGRIYRPAAHNHAWLKQIAIKSLLFPISLEFIQWGGFYGFTLMEEFTAKAFIGRIERLSIDDGVWTVMYSCYWVLTIYLLGFVSFQFVFVTRIIVKDTVSFMCLFGRTSILQIVPVVEDNKNVFVRCVRYILNFLTMDLIDCSNDEKVYYNCTQISKSQSENEEENYICKLRNTPVTPLFSDDNGQQTPKHDLKNILESDIDSNHLSPTEASEVFSTFINEVEQMTSPFTLFTVILTFFGIINLATHTVLFIRKDTKHLSYWTFFRTFIFLLIAIRMLLCVQHVTIVLGKLPRHVKFLHTSGKLGYNDANFPSWKDFFELLDSYKLGKKSFGFPLTLREIASLATFLNMSFLIVLSVFKMQVSTPLT